MAVNPSFTLKVFPNGSNFAGHVRHFAFSLLLGSGAHQVLTGILSTSWSSQDDWNTHFPGILSAAVQQPWNQQLFLKKKLDQLSYHSFILLRQCMEWIYLHIAGLKFKSFYYVCCGRAGTAQNYYISAVSDCLLAPSTRADDFPNNLVIQWVKSDFYERKTKNLTIIGVN